MAFAQSDWLRHHRFEPNEKGVVTTNEGRFGLGAVLIVECPQTQRYLMVRKSSRPGYEMNDRLAFPGGMVRSNGRKGSITDWIRESLRQRVRAEVGLDVEALDVRSLEDHPPVIATYSVHRKSVTTAILAFTAETTNELPPVKPRDDSIYDGGWRTLEAIWPEISDANGLSLAQLVWERLSQGEQLRVMSLLVHAGHAAIRDAIAAGAPKTSIPWDSP